jgi:hypothetical protein
MRREARLTRLARTADELAAVLAGAGAAPLARRRRDEMRALFAELPDDAWTRGGVHTDSRGRRTLDELLTVMAWHDDNHLDQLRRALDGRP